MNLNFMKFTLSLSQILFSIFNVFNYPQSSLRIRTHTKAMNLICIINFLSAVRSLSHSVHEKNGKIFVLKLHTNHDLFNWIIRARDRVTETRLHTSFPVCLFTVHRISIVISRHLSPEHSPSWHTTAAAFAEPSRREKWKMENIKIVINDGKSTGFCSGTQMYMRLTIKRNVVENKV